MTGDPAHGGNHAASHVNTLFTYHLLYFSPVRKVINYGPLLHIRDPSKMSALMASATLKGAHAL